MWASPLQRGAWLVLNVGERLLAQRRTWERTSRSQAGHTAPDRDSSLDLLGAACLCSRQGPWAARGSYKEHPCPLPPATMRAPLLLMLLALGSALRSPQPPEARAKLCGHHLVRTLVRVCGGPRWSPEATQPVETRDRELLQWLEQRHLLHALVADVDPALDPQLPLQASQRQRRSAATNAVHRCCLTGCTQQDLLGLCPH